MILLHGALPDPYPTTVTMGELCGQFNSGYVFSCRVDESQAPGPWGLVYMRRRGENAIDTFIFRKMPVNYTLGGNLRLLRGAFPATI